MQPVCSLDDLQRGHMAPNFERLARTTWKAHVDGVGIFIDDQAGDPNQLSLPLPPGSPPTFLPFALKELAIWTFL